MQKWIGKANAKGLIGTEKEEFINKKINAFTAERSEQMENEVQKSAEELENEMLEAIKNCKAVDD